jgi:4-amino-4-deoxy-L-arabinose transferase-like glycosyltransferase
VQGGKDASAARSSGPPPGHFLLLGGLAAALFLFNLGGYDIWPPDEPRFAEVARQMVLRGDYLAPYLNGEPYTEKPPLLFWSMIAASFPSFEITPWSARIPSAVAGVLTVLVTYAVAWEILGARAAWWAALILMTCSRFWFQARFGQIDMLLTACLMLSFYGLWRWEQSRSAGWLPLIYGGLALGLLAKGPPALVFVLLFILSFYWRNREARKRLHWVAGTLCALAVVLAWFIPARMAIADTAGEAVQSGMGENLFRNTIGRLVYGVSKAQPPWYYAETIVEDLVPWTFFLPWAIAWAWKQRRASLGNWFLWCWTVPALIFFSISVGKRAIYILPLFPVFAMWVAAGMLAMVEDGWRKTLRGIGILFGLILLLAAAVPQVISLEQYGMQPGIRLQIFAGLLLVLGLGAVALSCFATRASHDLAARQRWHIRVPAMMLAVSVVLLLGAAGLALPETNGMKSAKDICAPVRALAEAGADFRLYSAGFSREEYIFYSRKNHVPVYTELIGTDMPTGEALLKEAERQRRARKIIADAVADVPVADLGAVTAEERAALYAAMEAAIEAEGGEDAASLRVFEDELRHDVGNYARDFSSGTAAFMYIQEEDWRWLVTLWPEDAAIVVLRHEKVGRREVLLIANAAGAALAGSVSL